MSLEVAVHSAQTSILRELLFKQSAGYADLQKPTGLTSDHFNFHINRLMELGLVERIERGRYKLTIVGKEYANKLDTESSTIERQPKMAVMLAISNGSQYVIQERIKNPNFGFFGFPTGKVRWGETIVDAARRECMEETGLDLTFRVNGVYHEQVTLDDDQQMEDKIFFICLASAQGDIPMIEFEGGRNQWLRLDELQKKDKKFQSLPFETEIIQTDTWLIEKTINYNKTEF